MQKHEIETLQRKLRSMADELKEVYEKVLALEEDLLDKAEDQGITVERIDPRLPRQHKPKGEEPTSPGDADARDPWHTHGGTADWDTKDAVHTTHPV